MSFDPVGFYDLSVELFEGGLMFASSDANVNLAFQRNLVGRIYYALLLQIAQKYHMSLQGVSDSHRAVAEKLKPYYRNMLHDMKQLRIKADYVIGGVVDLNDVNDQFHLYKTTIENI